MLRMNIQGVHRMRTNIVLDPKLIALAMRKAEASTIGETVDVALREFVRQPDYNSLLRLGGSDTITPGYDPKSGDQPAGRP
jgi:Arc/MetJ family transcription regulator